MLLHEEEFPLPSLKYLSSISLKKTFNCIAHLNRNAFVHNIQMPTPLSILKEHQIHQSQS